MNPYRAPVMTKDDDSTGLLRGVLSVFCFGWAFGTAARGEFDAFAMFGIIVFISGVLLLRASGDIETKLNSD